MFLYSPPKNPKRQLCAHSDITFDHVQAPPGILAVDGERVPYGPIQVQVFKALATIVA